MKKYHTGKVIIVVFILFVLWGGWKLSADVTYMDGYESYGFFRYQAYLSTYQDKKAGKFVCNLSMTKSNLILDCWSDITSRSVIQPTIQSLTQSVRNIYYDSKNLIGSDDKII